MRAMIAIAALMVASGAQAAGNAAVESASFVESKGADGASAIRRIEPAGRLARGARIVTVLSWEAPPPGRHLATSRVPTQLALQSVSRGDVELSTDGGRNWRPLGANRTLPAGVTHIRWLLGTGEGQLSYRAIVR